MTLTTKFEIGETVFYLSGNQIEKGQITAIKFFKDRDNSYINYRTKSEEFGEKALFKSKEELLKSL